MGQGSFVLCEFDSVQEENSKYQIALRKLETDMLLLCATDWHKSFGKLRPGKNQYGRTTILPPLFDDRAGLQMATWRQRFIAAGHQTLMSGTRAGNVIPEDFKVALAGFMLPNKNMHLTEIKMQISNRKYGRLNLEEIQGYNKPAIILEEGIVINEEESFELYGFIEGPIPTHADGFVGVYQRIIPLGFCVYKFIDKVLGNTGAII